MDMVENVVACEMSSSLLAAAQCLEDVSLQKINFDEEELQLEDSSVDLVTSSLSCDDPRLCGVTVLMDGRPVLTVIGCYMPYWDGQAGNSEEYDSVIAKLDALIMALRPSAPVVVAD
ncbi:hypothetical protein FJT64_012464 [Amphibalanus amphitrite]|uniref:Uncharacterized protein n=1 Tax=Amphibalanus amphitrite TaxID=1232801 RepID=A0A6A4VDA5_AMPAM|nr:hypothetical protein FJT64_012464 [Amphibalanus amphitrite]